MYTDFHAVDRWTRQDVHCIYQALIVAIATRHADAVDIKFLVGGRQVWVALPLPAWAQYQKSTGKVITDPLAIDIAGHYLKTALESGEGVGREVRPEQLDPGARPGALGRNVADIERDEIHGDAPYDGNLPLPDISAAAVHVGRERAVSAEDRIAARSCCRRSRRSC